jgi:hypothetical protein
MILIKRILWGCLLIFTTLVSAQTTLPVPRNFQRAYDEGTRDISGMPGANYWQNFAAYDLDVHFEPATRLISGTEGIDYINNSPDTMNIIVFNLFPNLYQKGATRMKRIDSTDISSGIKISKMVVNGKIIELQKLKFYGTIMVVNDVDLPPKQSVHFDLTYTYTLNKGSHIRTGQIDDGAWFIAYFFPRIAVQDDLNGYNALPYLGTQEFYNDFCDFKTAITVPKDYVVWATGDLKNSEEVLAPEYCRRLVLAEKSDEVTTIIDSTDLKNGGITTNHPENTFRFEAKNVTDVAVAISNHYLWKSCSLVVDSSTMRRTRVDAVFNPKHKGFFEVVDFARKTVGIMSFDFPRWPFPYSHETVFDGVYSGMEYPMMVNEKSNKERSEDIYVTLHEIFHTMFPFYMGINETKYGWMDEGWAQLSNLIIGPEIDSTDVGNLFRSVSAYEIFAGKEDDSPIITLTTQENGASLLNNSYNKPSLGYLYVKDLLGEELFYKGLHQYIRNWNGKHPMPLDFFNSMNTGSGLNLNWFWKRWFYDSSTPDLALGKFTNGKKKKSIIVEMKGSKPVPVDLTVRFTDGAVQKIHQSVGVWEQGNTTVDIRFASGKMVKEITLGSSIVPDINKKDNHLIVKE